MTSNLYLKMLEHLRVYEEVMLYGNLLEVNAAHEKEAGIYLLSEYAEEQVDFPFVAPTFDETAALWASKIVYRASQLMLYRENKESDLDLLLPAYTGEITASAILSADLTLRFLSDILLHLKLIDPEDAMIKVLERHLLTWHYSGISYSIAIETIEFNEFVFNDSLLQLYINRVIENKKLHLAHHPFLKNAVAANLGMFTQELWKDFNTERITNE